jgi:signal transduction histidine kinase/CheY-like chemotaxis protein
MDIEKASIEEKRLAAVRACGLIGNEPIQSFDRIVRLAQATANVPTALVSIVDAEKIWIKASIGFGVDSLPSEGAFCRLGVEASDILWIEDTRTCSEFSSHEFVVGEPFVRFYAGAPILLPSGDAVGVLAIADQSPRPYCANLAQQLQDLAALASDQIELRRRELSVGRERAMFERLEKLAGVGFLRIERGKDEMFWSPGAYHLLGRDPNEPMPTQSEQMRRFPDQSQVFAGLTLKAMQTGEILRADLPEMPYWLEGRKLTAAINPGVQDDGTWDFVEIAVIDETVAKTALQKACDSENMMRMAHGLVDAATWEINFKNKTAEYVDCSTKLFQFAPSYREYIKDPFVNVHPSDKTRCKSEWDQHDWTKGPLRFEYRIASSDDVERYALSVCHVELAETGMPSRAFGIVMETTAARLATQKLEAALKDAQTAQHRFELANRIASAEIFEIDHENRRISSSNSPKALIRDLGTYDDFIADPWKSIHPEDVDEAKSTWIAHDWATGPYRHECRALPDGGPQRWMRFVTHQDHDAKGNALRSINFVIDTTHERNAIEASVASAKRLSAVSERLGLAMSIADAAVFECDFEKQTVVFSEKAERILGRTITFDEYVRDPGIFTHPTERKAVINAIMQHDWSAGPYKADVPLAFPAASRENARWGRFATQLILNEFGVATRLLCFVTDITGEKSAQFALAAAATKQAEARETMELAIEMAGAIVWEHDWATHEFIVDEKAAVRSKIRRPDSVGLDVILGVVHPSERRKVRRAFEQLMISDVPFCSDQRFAMEDGSYEWHQCHIKIIRDANGNPIRTIGFAKNVHEAKLAEQRLIDAERRANEASLAKNDFLANMSHEIRTPLNGIVGVASMLSQSTLNPAQKEMADLISSSGELLERVLNDVLDYAKIEAGQLTIEAAPFNLGEALKSVTGLFAERARDKGIEFVCKMSKDVDAEYFSDAIRLRQIVSNLLSNATKFTDHGSVTLEVDVQADSVEEASNGSTIVIRVIDTGIGFDAETRDRLFSRFEQADASITRKFGGTGLGLAISQQLATMMGGSLSAEGELGVGATFVATIRAPRLVSRCTEAAVIESRTEVAETFDRPIRILVAEDNPNNRRVMALLLAPLEADIMMVENGALAVDAVMTQAFDVVLMDVQMPIMDGHTAMRTIRTWERETQRAPIPIIAVTANAMDHHILESAQAGANQHLAKPINPQALIDCIALALELAEENALRNAEKAA